MNFVFTSVTKKNIKEIAQLSVSNSQLGTVETVIECFEEAKDYEKWRPYAIVYKGEYIGFIMYGEFIDPYQVWFDRFFIDEKYQGKGYGKAVIPVILEKIEKEYSCKEIYLSVYPDNIPAINLYKYMGFVFTGELDTKGEHIMVLKLKRRG